MKLELAEPTPTRFASVGEMLRQDDYAWDNPALSFHARSISISDLLLKGDESVKTLDIAKMTRLGPNTQVVSIARDGDIFTLALRVVVIFADRSRLAVDLNVKGIIEMRSDIRKRWPRYDQISVTSMCAA
jgi:hypothetical protein